MVSGGRQTETSSRCLKTMAAHFSFIQKALLGDLCFFSSFLTLINTDRIHEKEYSQEGSLFYNVFPRGPLPPKHREEQGNRNNNYRQSCYSKNVKSKEEKTGRTLQCILTGSGPNLITIPPLLFTFTHFQLNTVRHLQSPQELC